MNRFTFYLLILLGFNFVTFPVCISQNIYVTDYTSVNSIEIFDVINLPTGEVIAMGSTIIAGQNELVLSKSDVNGRIVWSNVLSSSSTDYFHAGRLVAAHNNGFAVLASASDGGKSKTVVLKVDNAGNVVWSNKFNNGQGEVTNDIASTNDGGFVLTGGGCIGNNLFVHKISSTGKSEWFKLVGSTTQHEMGLAITQMPNNDLVVGGSTLNVSNTQDVIVIRLDINGNTIWEMNYGTTSNDLVQRIEQKNGFIYIAGNVQSTINSSAFVSKINANGSGMVWNKELTNSAKTSVFDMAILNNSLVLSGLINSVNGYGNDDASLISIDLNGNLIKNILVGDATNNFAKAISSNGNGLTVLSNLYNGIHNVAQLDNDLFGFCDFKIGNAQLQNQLTNSSNLKPSTFLIGVMEEVHVLNASNFNLSSNNLNVSANFNYTVKSTQIALNSLSTGAVNYTWDFGDGNAVNDVNPKHVFSTSGTYTVCLTVTNNLGCTDTKCSDVTVKMPADKQLNIDKYLPATNTTNSTSNNDDTDKLNDVIKVITYPNPVVNDLTFQVIGDKKISSINILSGNGQLLGNNKMGVSKANISVIDLAPGVYFYQIKIENQDQLVSGRFIKN